MHLYEWDKNEFDGSLVCQALTPGTEKSSYTCVNVLDLLDLIVKLAVSLRL